MSNESTGSIIIAPRQIATGDPAGRALENVITTPLGDGCLCYVSTGAGKGLWQLDKTSTEVASATILEPIAGPGRWILKLSGGSTFEPASGMSLRDTRAYAMYATATPLSVGVTYELKNNPQSIAGALDAPLMRPQLTNASLTKLYEIELNFPIRWSGVTVQAAYQINLQVSVDGGSTWADVEADDARVYIDATAVAGASSEVFRTSRFLGSDVVGLTEGGTLMARATYSQQVGSGSETFIINANSNFPQMQCTLREILA